MSETILSEAELMSWIDAEISRLKGLIRVTGRERDELKEQLVAVQARHENALNKERDRVNWWMAQRDKQCDRAIKAETERDELRRLLERIGTPSPGAAGSSSEGGL